MKSKTLILIPPSEGKTLEGTHPPLKNINNDALLMIEKLQNYSGDLQKLLDVKGITLEKSVQINQTILTSKTCPAIERYSGVVFKAIDYPSLSPKGKSFFNEHIRIVSALFGLVKPQDLIPNYKLKINKLNAHTHFLPQNSHTLKNTFIINLLPQAHQKAVAFEKGITLDFKILKNKKIQPAGHRGKFIKGRFIRWLCQNQITDQHKLRHFSEEGFTWNDKNNDHFLAST